MIASNVWILPLNGVIRIMHFYDIKGYLLSRCIVHSLEWYKQYYPSYGMYPFFLESHTQGYMLVVTSFYQFAVHWVLMWRWCMWSFFHLLMLRIPSIHLCFLWLLLHPCEDNCLVNNLLLKMILANKANLSSTLDHLWGWCLLFRNSFCFADCFGILCLFLQWFLISYLYSVLLYWCWLWNFWGFVFLIALMIIICH